MALLDKHKAIETHATLLMVLAFLVVNHRRSPCRSCRCSTLRTRSRRWTGCVPYTPLELAGRDIYVREGCYVCHSQMTARCGTRSNLWPLQPCRGFDVRPSVPVGVQAHRAGPRPRGWPLFGRMAPGPLL